MNRAERAIQIHVVRDPSLAVVVSEAIDANRLHDETRRILEVATEFPAACRLTGIMDVAGSIPEPIEFLEYLDGLERLPDWFIGELPSFDAAVRELATPKAIPEAGALDEWRSEVRAGRRSKHTFDGLWRAAVSECQARDYLKAGMIGAANEERRKAAKIILDTAARERAS